MRRSSVATMTFETIGEACTRRYTCSIIERPSMSASGFPGKRVEANRAGMTAMTCSGGVVSTAEPVDAGCTTNNSTPPGGRVVPSQRLMQMKRMISLGAGGGALAVWFATAATTTPSGVAVAPMPKRPAAVDMSSAALATEVARLHERLRPEAAPLHARDLFRYRAAPAPRVAMAAPVDVPAVVLPPLVIPPEMSLIGLAEE